MLLRYSNVTDSCNVLAPVWQRLANCHKSEEQHTVLSHELQKMCISRALSTELYVAPPIITSTLKQMVMGFQFTGFVPDDLLLGCQPFLVSYAGSAHHYVALAATHHGNQLSGGGGEMQV